MCQRRIRDFNGERKTKKIYNSSTLVLCLFQMTVGWQAFLLLCCVLSFVEPSPPSTPVQDYKYNISFRLTRSTRTHVEQLLRKYVSTGCHCGSCEWPLQARPALLTSIICLTQRFLLFLQKEQQLGDAHFEDRSQQLRGLPLLSTDFFRWLQLSVSICSTKKEKKKKSTFPQKITC